MNSKTANILFVVLIIVVFVFVIFTTSYLIRYKEAFTKNPIIFGAKKMGLGECSCICYNDVDIKPLSLKFNATSLSYGENLLN